MIIRVLVALTALAMTASAAEVVRRDAQLSLGLTPTDFDYTINAPGGEFSGNDSFDAGWQLRGGGRWALTRPGWSIAPVIGGDLSYATIYGAGGELSYLGVGLTGGAAWAINERWSADAELGLGYGMAHLSLDEDTSLSGSGDLFLIDLRTRILYQLGRTWSVGAEVGWQRADGAIAANRDRDVDLTLGGFTVGIMVIWRLSMRPAALE